MDWHNFKRSLRILNEVDNHSHVPNEFAHMFTSVQFEDTEIDFLDLMYGIVRAKKPLTLLETGTHLGLSSLAIGFALKENSRQQSPEPHLHTVEQNAEDAIIAQKRFVDTGLTKWISVHIHKSIDFIQNIYVGPPFDIIFFDSSRSVRPEEYYQLRTQNLISPGCILLFHDTSEVRAESLPDQKESQTAYLSSLKQIASECNGFIKFELSRGFTMLQKFS